MGGFRRAGETDFHKVNVQPSRDSGLSWHESEEERAAMSDTIFTISTVIFFVLSVLYVKFCDGLR